MRIYIPNHLEESIPIIKQLSLMIQKYSETQNNTSINSFDHYYLYYSMDIVKRFIEICLENQLSTDDELEDPEYYNGIVNYLVKLFYSVKGTKLVFAYLRDYLGLKFEGEIIYTVHKIDFTISEITTSNISLYVSSLKDFLSTLLYFGDLSVIIRAINLKVDENLVLNIHTDLSCRYKEFSVTSEFIP